MSATTIADALADQLALDSGRKSELAGRIATGQSVGTALLGLATALSNAQAILFITSIFAVTGLLRANAATACVAVLIIVLCNASYLSALGWLFRRERMRAGYARYRRVLEGSIGSVFLLFGGRMLWQAGGR